MTETRSLTEYEIEDILSFIIPQKGIPSDTALSVVNINKQGLRYQLQQVKIYPQMISKLSEMIEKQYFTSKIQAGESVGVIGAQSIGEKQTQTSVCFSTPICIKKNGIIVNTTIGKYIDNEMKNGIIVETSLNGYIKPVDNVQILSVSQDEKMNWMNMLRKHLLPSMIRAKTISLS